MSVYPPRRKRLAPKKNFAETPAYQGFLAALMVLMRIQASSKHEYLFVNRKGFHSINVQVVCHGDMKLIDVVARWYGSARRTHLKGERSCKSVRRDGSLV